MFSESDVLMKHSWLVIADLGSRQGQREERIYLAADFDEGLFKSVLKEQVRQVDELDWDEREGVLRAERQLKVGELVLSSAPLANLDEEARVQALINYIRRKGIELLPWTPELRQWQARVALLRDLDLEKGSTSDQRRGILRQSRVQHGALPADPEKGRQGVTVGARR
jgi:ATP-dependent helicase HrpB